jgi:hypothetical protein
VSCYSILAAAEPGVSRASGPGLELAIDLQIEGLTAELADYVARCLRQIHGVERVLTSEKRPAG